MDNFVLYDEISSSDGVTVYKGRRKGTINFLAIYCIDKRMRAEITNQVRLTHELQHDNVVRFAEWYETSNHLWLVVELCTGGELSTLIRQDGRLPESCVRQFAIDLVAGLHFVHSVGIVLGIVHAEGVQLDASGTLKLSDFRAARLENENLGELYEQFAPLGRAGAGASTSESSNTLVLDEDAVNDEEGEGGKARGVSQRSARNANGNSGSNGGSEVDARFERLRPRLAYTPPEFVGRASSEWFMPASGCDIATDFWQLGCLLFEMFVGAPPFGDERTEAPDEVRNRILYQPVDFSPRETHAQPPASQLPNAHAYAAATSARHLRERPSAEFASLINNLLEKDPRKRATWTALIAHRFWRGELERRVRAANASSIVLDSATMGATNESDADAEPDVDAPGLLETDMKIRPQSRENGGETAKVQSTLSARPRTAVAEEAEKTIASGSASGNDLAAAARRATPGDAAQQSVRQSKATRANVEVERSEREPQPRVSSLASSSAYRSLLLTAQTVFAQTNNANVASNDDANSSMSSSVTVRADDESSTNSSGANADAHLNNRHPSAASNQKAVLRSDTSSATEVDEARRNALLNLVFAESGPAAQPGAATCSALVALLAKLCNVGSSTGTSPGPAGKLLTAKYDAKLVSLNVTQFTRLARLTEPELAELCDVLATETRRTLFAGTSTKQPPSAKALHCINFLLTIYSSATGIERLTARLVRDGRFIAALANELTSALPFSNAALVDFRVRTAYLFGMLLAIVARVANGTEPGVDRVVLDTTLTGALRAVLNGLVEQLRDQTAFRNTRFRLVATHCVFQLCLLLSSSSASDKASSDPTVTNFALPNGVVALVVRIVRDCFATSSGGAGGAGGNSSVLLAAAADRGTSAPAGEREALASPNEPLSIAQLLLTLKFAELLLHGAGAHASRLLTAELVGALLSLLKPPQNDAVRAGALCVLVRACRSAPAAFHAAFDKLASEFHSAFGELLAAFGSAPAAPVQSAANTLASRVLERALTLLLGGTLTGPTGADKQSAALLNRLVQATPTGGTGTGTRAQSASAGSGAFLETLFRALDKASSPLLKAKVYLLVATLVRANAPLLVECCQLKLVFYVERDLAAAHKQPGRRPSVGAQAEGSIVPTNDGNSNSPLNSALEMLFGCLEELLPGIANDIVVSIRSLRDRRHVAAAQVRTMRSRLAFLNVLLFVAHSSALRDRLVDAAFVRFVGALFTTLGDLTLSDTNLDTLLDQRRAFAELLTYALTLLDSLVRAPQVLLRADANAVDELLVGVLRLVRALLIDAPSATGNATNLSSLRSHELAELRTAVARYATELGVGLLCELTVLDEHGDATMTLAASGAREATERIIALLNEHFLEHGETMLFDHAEPIAACYLRVLVACLDQLTVVVPAGLASPAKFGSSSAALQTVSLVFEKNLHQALLQFLHERLLDLSSFDVAPAGTGNTKQQSDAAPKQREAPGDGERHEAAVTLILDCFHLLFANGTRLLLANDSAANNGARFRECFDFALVDLLVRAYRVYIPADGTPESNAAKLRVGESQDDDTTSELRAALVRCANALVTFVSDQTRSVLSATQQSKSVPATPRRADATPRDASSTTPFTAEQVEELLQSAKPLTAIMPFCVLLLDPSASSANPDRKRVLDETIAQADELDSEQRRIALNVLSLLAQLYGGEGLRLLSDREAIERFCRALESLTQHSSVRKLGDDPRSMRTRSIDDQRAARTLLRVLKRLISTDRSYTAAIRRDGDSLVTLLRTIRSTASSNADSNTQTLCAEILAKLDQQAG